MLSNKKYNVINPIGGGPKKRPCGNCITRVKRNQKKIVKRCSNKNKIIRKTCFNLPRCKKMKPGAGRKRRCRNFCKATRCAKRRCRQVCRTNKIKQIRKVNKPKTKNTVNVDPAIITQILNSPVMSSNNIGLDTEIVESIKEDPIKSKFFCGQDRPLTELHDDCNTITDPCVCGFVTDPELNNRHRCRWSISPDGESCKNFPPTQVANYKLTEEGRNVGRCPVKGDYAKVKSKNRRNPQGPKSCQKLPEFMTLRDPSNPDGPDALQKKCKQSISWKMAGCDDYETLKEWYPDGKDLWKMVPKLNKLRRSSKHRHAYFDDRGMPGRKALEKWGNEPKDFVGPSGGKLEDYVKQGEGSPGCQECYMLHIKPVEKTDLDEYLKGNEDKKLVEAQRKITKMEQQLDEIRDATDRIDQEVSNNHTIQEKHEDNMTRLRDKMKTNNQTKPTQTDQTIVNAAKVEMKKESSLEASLMKQEEAEDRLETNIRNWRMKSLISGTFGKADKRWHKRLAHKKKIAELASEEALKKLSERFAIAEKLRKEKLSTNADGIEIRIEKLENELDIKDEEHLQASKDEAFANTNFNVEFHLATEEGNEDRQAGEELLEETRTSISCNDLSSGRQCKKHPGCTWKVTRNPAKHSKGRVLSRRCIHKE